MSKVSAECVTAHRAVSSSATADRASSSGRAARRHKTRTESSIDECSNYEEAQSSALRALTKSLASKHTSLLSLVQALTHPVINHDGNAAFSQYFVEHEVSNAMKSDDQAKNYASLAVTVLRSLIEQTCLNFSDIVGQILWHFRKSDVLQKGKHQVTIDDLTWLGMPAVENTVEHVFSLFADKRSGRISIKAFQKLMDHMFGVYKDSSRSYTSSTYNVRRTDWERLFYAETLSEGIREISLLGFTRFLVQLARAMGAHPGQILSKVTKKRDVLDRRSVWTSIGV